MLALNFPKNLEPTSLGLYFWVDDTSEGIHMRDNSSHWGVGGTQDLLEGVAHPVDECAAKCSLAGRAQVDR